MKFDAPQARKAVNLFGITHWIIVLLVVLMVFGPEKLPELARTLGRALAEFRRASMDFRRVIEDELSDIERQTRERAQQAARSSQASTTSPEPAGAVPAGPPAASLEAHEPVTETISALPPHTEGHVD